MPLEQSWCFCSNSSEDGLSFKEGNHTVASPLTITVSHVFTPEYRVFKECIHVHYFFHLIPATLRYATLHNTTQQQDRIIKVRVYVLLVRLYVPPPPTDPVSSPRRARGCGTDSATSFLLSNIIRVMSGIIIDSS